MSIVDKVIAAVTPPESEEARMEARLNAQAAAVPGGWLSAVLGHHIAIEAAFAAVKAASTAPLKRAAQKELQILLNGHSVAEEAVLYPALALNDEKGHAEMGYLEQSMVKVQLFALESIDPLSQDYSDKLEHIRGAVAHHVYQEESTWFLELQDKTDADTASRLAARYLEEFKQYVSVTASYRVDNVSTAV
jgi:hypothetical protein